MKPYSRRNTRGDRNTISKIKNNKVGKKRKYIGYYLAFTKHFH